jgi:hypothetical protein
MACRIFPTNTDAITLQEAAQTTDTCFNSTPPYYTHGHRDLAGKDTGTVKKVAGMDITGTGIQRIVRNSTGQYTELRN